MCRELSLIQQMQLCFAVIAPPQQTHHPQLTSHQDLLPTPTRYPHHHTHTVALQGSDGHLKPIPSEDDFATPRRGERGGRSSPADPDLALAIRLQQEEMARMQAAPTQPPLPQFARNPVGPQPPPSLPQRARSVIPCEYQESLCINVSTCLFHLLCQ